MNTPSGYRVPATLLPAIDAIIGNELVILFVQPGADKSIVEAHWQSLQLCFKGMMKFIDLRDLSETLPLFEARLADLRRGREEQSFARIVIYNTSPRFSRMELEADVSFYYCPGVGQVNLQRGKCRRAATPNTPKVLELFPHTSPEQKLPVTRRLQVIIAGDRPGCGKTTLAVELRNFLTERFPNVTVAHFSSEDDGIKRECNTDDHTLDAEELQVIDINSRPIKPTALWNQPRRASLRPYKPRR